MLWKHKIYTQSAITRCFGDQWVVLMLNYSLFTGSKFLVVIFFPGYFIELTIVIFKPFLTKILLSIYFWTIIMHAYSVSLIVDEKWHQKGLHYTIKWYEEYTHSKIWFCQKFAYNITMVCVEIYYGRRCTFYTKNNN